MRPTQSTGLFLISHCDAGQMLGFGSSESTDQNEMMADTTPLNITNIASTGSSVF
jgi:hypothetical protein